MPFALLLFFLGGRALQEPTLARCALVGLSMALCVLAKPNYVLAYGPCLALAFLVAYFLRAKVDRSGRLSLISGPALMFGPTVFLLAWQFATAFGDNSPQKASVILAPFAVWSLYSPNILASILLSITFPLVVTICYARESLKDREMLLAW